MKRFLAFVFLLMSIGSAVAADAVNTIRENFTNAGQAPLAIRPSQVKGLYFVVLPQGPVYVDETGTHVIQGQVFDLQSHASLTSKELADATPSVKWTSLPFADAIKTVKGNGKRKMAVFSDPDCPYCRMLEQQSLNKIDNVTIYTFLFPLPQLHPDANRKSRLIWCAPNRAKAWSDWMEKNVLPVGEGNCANPIDRNAKLGTQLWVFGTPGMFFQSGDRLMAAMPADEVEKHL